MTSTFYTLVVISVNRGNHFDDCYNGFQRNTGNNIERDGKSGNSKNQSRSRSSGTYELRSYLWTVIKRENL